jgi:hypothetical protein
MVYKGIIETRLAAYPELSAVRLLGEIRAAGHTGGYTQLMRIRARSESRSRVVANCSTKTRTR